MSAPSVLSERQFHLIWRLGLFQKRGLLLEDGRALAILSGGRPSVEGGPDFKDARLRFAGGPEVSGDVELHRTPSEWKRHQHSKDSAYCGVILHVALRRDLFSGQAAPFRGGAIPELVLEPYLELSVAELSGWTGASERPCSDEAARLARFEELGWERFERRRRTINRVAQIAGRDEAVYREIMTALGYKSNKAPFSELARLVPWKRVEGRTESEIDHAYRVGDHLPWRVRCGRPANHPKRRLRGWCAVAAGARSGLLELEADWIVQASGGKIGTERAWAILVNVIYPARGDRRAVENCRIKTIPRAVVDVCSVQGISPSRVETVLLQWGALEWLNRFNGIAPDRVYESGEISNRLAAPQGEC